VNPLAGVFLVSFVFAAPVLLMIRTSTSFAVEERGREGREEYKTTDP